MHGVSATITRPPNHRTLSCRIASPPHLLAGCGFSFLYLSCAWIWGFTSGLAAPNRPRGVCASDQGIRNADTPCAASGHARPEELVNLSLICVRCRCAAKLGPHDCWRQTAT